MPTLKAPKIRDLIRGTKGKFFSVEFTKKDGTLRHLTGRVGVRKHIKGVGMNHDPEALGHVIVWDTTKRGYRTVDCNKVSYFCSGKKKYGTPQTNVHHIKP